MIIGQISIGSEDYDRNQYLRFTLFNVSLALGHNYAYWIAFDIDCLWPGGLERTWKWIHKGMYGERFFEMLIRRFAPDWRAP